MSDQELQEAADKSFKNNKAAFESMISLRHGQVGHGKSGEATYAEELKEAEAKASSLALESFILDRAIAYRRRNVERR